MTGTPAPTIFVPPRRTVQLSPRQRLAFAVFVWCLMAALCAPFFLDTIRHDAPRPANGRVDYSSWGPLSAPVELNGDWRMTWVSREPGPSGKTFTVPVPGGWNNARLPDGAQLPAHGVASYRLVLGNLRPGQYKLHIPIIFGANRILLNGVEVASAGTIGTTAATTRYVLHSHDVALTSDGRPVELRIDIASFLHRETGIGEVPVIGLSEPMQRWTALQWSKDLLFHSALVLLAANSLVAYLFRRRDTASLLLAVAALLALPGSAILSYDNMLLLLFPNMGFGPMLTVQYLATDIGAMALVAYSRALFPVESPRRIFWFLEGLLAVFTMAQILTFASGDTLAASQVAIAWPLVSGLAFLGMILFIYRATRQGRPGAFIFLLGVIVFALFYTNAALTWSGLLPDALAMGSGSLPLGLLMLLFSNFIVIAERWSIAVVEAEQTNDELRELLEVSSAIVSEIDLEVLLAKIVEATSRILNADRSSLLIHDPKRGELWSLVAEGLTTREIRVPTDTGLAGHAFTHGETVNIADAYADPRFNREVDIRTGYRTKSVLTMPVTTRDGRHLGVMQALNRRGLPAFSEGDVKRMAAFAAQAAIAIDNATLFSEVIASRNYNESILRSMASGVVTIDKSGEIAKLNVAARAILHVDGEEVDADFKTVLAESNPWLADEVVAVGKTGDAKLLYDIDVAIGGGGTVAANLSIVPLVAEEKTVGVLILIEDISEGKRLQGAMRRFLTQRVVDQVLARGDDLLFGAACEASVLFADIRNFTSMSEKLTPRETVDMLNEAFTEFFEAVSASDGVLDKFIGDAIMAVYGAPLSTGRDPENAVDSAVEMLRMCGMLNVSRAARDQPPLRLGVGISTGEVVAGTIGSPKRMDYTVIGDSVNLAARLQSLTKSYGVEVIVCEKTAAAVALTHSLRELDLIRVRGRQRPEKIFQVLLTPLPSLADYARGRELLGEGDYAGAAAAFARAVALDATDKPAQLMMNRVQALTVEAPAVGWDGVWQSVD